MKAPLPISGSSTDAIEHNVPAVDDVGFAWLHLEGASYLRMPHSASIDAADIVVTVVGIADNLAEFAGWLLLA